MGTNPVTPAGGKPPWVMPTNDEQPQQSGNSNTPSPCPKWCPGDHPMRAGAVHRAEVGATVVGGKRVPVVIMQTPNCRPVVVISGPVYVEVADEDHDDMARLLELAGQWDLAELIQRAAEILRGGEGK